MIFDYGARFRTLSVETLSDKNKYRMPEVKPDSLKFYVDIPFIPFTLALASTSLDEAPENWRNERMSNGYSRFGHNLLAHIADSAFGGGYTFFKMPTGCPYGKGENGEYLGISVTHTRTMIWSAVAKGTRIGIDAEPVDRPVSESLFRRMQHPDEAHTLRVEPIRLWTLKEAVLKLLGTGLRINMSSVKLKRVTADIFECIWKDKSIRVISVEKSGHWLSIAYYH